VTLYTKWKANFVKQNCGNGWYEVLSPDADHPYVQEKPFDWVRGYQVMHGYYNLPEEADTAMAKDGWLRTGDIAAMDAEGYLRITGRLKDCIIRGGENIYPREIEDVLHEHPAVHEVNVVGAPDA